MIITRTPLRISFFGGGTDYPDYFENHGGAVLSTTIDKYVFITLNKMNAITDFPFKVTYSKTEKCHAIDEISHPSVRHCLQHFSLKEGMEIHIVNELPAKTGLGSSSSFTVGFLKALHTQVGIPIDKVALAMEAIYVEQKLIGEKVGVQDQSAAAIGGFNLISFEKGGIHYQKIQTNQNRLTELHKNLLLIYTGVQRFAEDIIPNQIKNTQSSLIANELKATKMMAFEGKEILESNRSLDEFGELLDQAWNLKKKFSSAISNTQFDDLYSKAKEFGALGGKMLGAGGGGFFLFYVKPESREKVKLALADLIEIPFKFEENGSSIIYQS